MGSAEVGLSDGANAYQDPRCNRIPRLLISPALLAKLCDAGVEFGSPDASPRSPSDAQASARTCG
jgi:hypothetical protein